MSECKTLCRLNLSAEVEHLQTSAQEGSAMEGAVLAEGTLEFTDTEGVQLYCA